MRGGAPADRARAAHSHRVGRPVPQLGCRAGRACDGGRSAQTSGLDDGQEDHGRFRHARQQGARSHRSPFPLLGVIQTNRYCYPPAIGDSWFRRVRRRLGARAGRIPDDGAPDPLRVDVSGPGARSGRAPLRPRRGRHADLRGAAARAVPGLCRRARGGAARRHGAGAVQRGERGGRAALPGREDPVWADSGGDREGGGTWDSAFGPRNVARGCPCRGRRGPPPGRASRMPLTILSLVIVLGVLISVHEFGHFIVAKAVGIQVLRFSLGFGRPLISWRRGETEYWISWIPLGGYVKMAGLEEEGMVGELEGGKADAAIDPARTFDKQPLWAHMAVILAGVTMNLFLAFVIYTGLLAVAGDQRLVMTAVDSVDASRVPAGAEALATLRRGDRIIRINGDSLKTWDDFDKKILLGPEALRFQIAGRPEPIAIHVARDTAARHQLARAIVPLLPPRIGPVTLGQPAHRAGLRPGDVVLRIDSDTIVSWTDMVRRIRESVGKPLVLTVLRGDSLVQIPITPVPTDSVGQHFGVIGAGVNPPLVRVPVGLGTALAVGVRQTGIGRASCRERALMAV